jgi:hypothetical protein
MRDRCQVIALSLLTLLIAPRLSFADPMVMPRAPFTFVPLLLLLEGFIIVYLAKSYKDYLIRFVVVWFFVTLLTWLPFFASQVFLTKLKGAIIAIAIGELVVVLIEAWTIYLFLRWEFLARNTKDYPSYWRCVVYSVIANLVSIRSGYLSFLFLFDTNIMKSKRKDKRVTSWHGAKSSSSTTTDRAHHLWRGRRLEYFILG